MIFYTYNSELYHHGVKGMKWGVRRYQNEDGSLTEAGKKKQAIKNAKKDIKELKKNKQSIRDVNKPTYNIYANNAIAVAKASLAKLKKGEKGEIKSYAKSLYKNNNPIENQILEQAIYTDKGKEYYDKVMKKKRNMLIRSASAAGLAFIGGSVVLTTVGAIND